MDNLSKQVSVYSQAIKLAAVRRGKVLRENTLPRSGDFSLNAERQTLQSRKTDAIACLMNKWNKFIFIYISFEIISDLYPDNIVR